MKKQIAKKIISIFLLSIFVFSFAISSFAVSDISNLYSNPNQPYNKNQYKFKVSDVVNSNLLTSVVGCTGVTSKVANWMTSFMQSPFKKSQQLKEEVRAYKEQARKACAAIKAGVQGGSGAIVGVNDMVTPVTTTLETRKLCESRVDMWSDDFVKSQLEQEKKDEEKRITEQCFNGIAVTLAKNQLTSMTRSAMNWVNSGYGGNPFFVQSMQRLTTNIERNVIDTGVNILLNQENQNPYARNFAESLYVSQGIRSNSANFLGNLSSDLSNFISSPDSYYNEDTQTRAQRSRMANDTFSRDFSSGGWDGWLAFTQRESNNPLGFNMVANQYLADMQASQIENTKEEVRQNNGFMSQKECIKWQEYEKDQNGDVKPKTKPLAGGMKYSYDFVYSKDKTNELSQCVDWKVITPGSLIKDKISSFLGSPERQLELARTINDSLNALFSVLLDKLYVGGLTSLSDDDYNKSNWKDNMNSLVDYSSSDGNTTYNNNGAYDGFNLTRDLGNTYIRDTYVELGKWNARDNETTDTKNPKLYPNLAPSVEKNNTPQYKYYTVTTPGNTKIVLEGHNSWVVGDRAIWDGEKWQNWKKNQSNPIKRRGVIQLQEDYIVAAKELMKVLPSVMTNLGELDYCLPGPNPNYKINSTEAQSAYQQWVGSMFVGPQDEFRVKWSIDTEKDQTYKDLANVFKDNPNTWKSVLSSSSMWLLDNFVRKWTPSGNAVIGQDYHYEPADNKTESANVKNRERLMKVNIEYTNNHLFQNFYAIFDKMMDEVYFKKMTSKYLEYENKSINTEEDQNPAYVPMAESGFELTRNMFYYNEDITKAINDYTESINQAKINISKLDPIKARVSAIITKAQERRNKELLGAANKDIVDRLSECKNTQERCDNQIKNPQKCQIDYNNCTAKAIKEVGRVKTLDDIKREYKVCLDEENIQFYDADTITNFGSEDGERCANNIDDDLDGLLDRKDPDCEKYYKELDEKNPPITNRSGRSEPVIKKCFLGPPITGEKGTNNLKCESRKTEIECIGDNYYNGLNANVCNWEEKQSYVPQIITTSFYGCRIKTTTNKKAPDGQQNLTCFLRTENECTKTNYIDTNNFVNTCEFLVEN